MKMKFFAIFMLVFVILGGIGAGFGLRYGLNQPIPETPGLSDDGNNKPSIDSGNDSQTPNSPELPENPDNDNNENNPSKPDVTVPDETEKPTEPETPELDFSKFYIEIDNEIISLKEFLCATTFTTDPFSSISDIDMENVTYTLTFNMEEIEMFGYDFEMVKELFSMALINNTITENGEQYSSTYDFNDDTFELVISYVIAG